MDTIIDNIKSALESYATDKCKTEIVEFSLLSGSGQILNKGETFQFKVRVSNESHLNMKNVRVRVNGTPFADVGRNGEPFSAYQFSGAFNLDAHNDLTTGIFLGKAKKVTIEPQKIITARIDSWNANLDDLLLNHTKQGEYEAAVNLPIQPD